MDYSATLLTAIQVMVMDVGAGKGRCAFNGMALVLLVFIAYLSVAIGSFP